MIPIHRVWRGHKRETGCDGSNCHKGKAGGAATASSTPTWQVVIWSAGVLDAMRYGPWLR